MMLRAFKGCGIMKDPTILKIVRTACGAALLITHAVTNVDGTLIVVSLFLLGVPFELIKRGE